MTTLNQSFIFGPAVNLVFVLVFSIIGCQRVEQPGNTIVQGRVTYQGQPLVGGLIVFTPDPERGGRGKPIAAEITREGYFHLAIDGSAAIPPGWYRVGIAPAPKLASAATDQGAIFPQQLARPDRSELCRDVKAGQENTFDFAIEAH